MTITGNKPIPDPLIVVYDADGEIVMALTLWEWIGRAIVLHNLPPAILDDVRVYLDGTEVLRNG